MRSLRHPGPPAPDRASIAPCRARPVTLLLRAGKSVNEAVTGALADAGFASGHVILDGLGISPMRYVIPAPAPDDSHVAWYSDTRAPEGIVTVEQAGVIAGSRDGEPFIHCHGVWREPDGARRAGHLLPHEAIIARDTTVRGWGIEGAAFVARDDAETNFKLFRAEAAGTPGSDGVRALACTIRPNGDICSAIETICGEHGFEQASVHGVGSLIGVDFVGGAHIPSYATEVFVREGRFSGDACRLDVALADMDGAVHEGELVRGANPVCVTFELLLVEAG